MLSNCINKIKISYNKLENKNRKLLRIYNGKFENKSKNLGIVAEW